MTRLLVTILERMWQPKQLGFTLGEKGKTNVATGVLWSALRSMIRMLLCLAGQ